MKSNHTPEQIEGLTKFKELLSNEEYQNLNKFLAEMKEVLASSSELKPEEMLITLNIMELTFLERLQESRKRTH